MRKMQPQAFNAGTGLESCGKQLVENNARKPCKGHLQRVSMEQRNPTKSHAEQDELERDSSNRASGPGCDDNGERRSFVQDEPDKK